MNKDSRVIEQQFFDYFTKRGFTQMDESPLVSDDPDLLYTIAGMIPFKPYFEGQTPPHNKIVTSQRCIRTNDIGRVGKTKRHLTGFTMLGHFQFGGFDRKEVLKQSHELLTEVYGLNPDRLVITCHPDDEETGNTWFDVFQDVDCIHLSKDNIWQSGKPGLSGYCTEIYYDLEPSNRGSRYESFDPEGDRFLEIYNIVFIDKNNGEPLEVPCVDSGIGLERLTYILGDYHNVCQVLGDRPPVIEDHLRTCEWIIGEGVKPSNTKQGYILRQLMRRLFRIEEFKFDSVVFIEEYWKYQKALERGKSKLSSMPNPTHEDLVGLYETYGIPLDMCYEILNETEQQQEKNQMKISFRYSEQNRKLSRLDRKFRQIEGSLAILLNNKRIGTIFRNGDHAWAACISESKEFNLPRLWVEAPTREEAKKGIREKLRETLKSQKQKGGNDNENINKQT